MSKQKTSILIELRHFLNSEYRVLASDSKSKKQIRMHTVSFDEDKETWSVRFVVVGFEKNGYNITRSFDSIDNAVNFYENDLK